MNEEAGASARRVKGVESQYYHASLSLVRLDSISILEIVLYIYIALSGIA